MTYIIHTLGCKVNQYESEVMAEAMEDAGILPAPSHADIVLINTCAVTAESERKARQLIRRSIKENPGAYVIVTGCYAQLRPEELSAIEGVSFVCGNRSKYTAAQMAIHYYKTGEMVKDSSADSLSGAAFEKGSIKKSERTRAYVKIEDGCESKCAYCTIKDARGPIRSKTIADTVDEIKSLVASGYREVVLTGIEISGFGKDTGEGDLSDLINALSDIKGLCRVRLGSLDPSLLTPAFVDRLAASKNLAHHFHLSLQSGCDKTLFAMRRRYNTSMIARNVAYIRQVFPDATFTADTIVGFPGESEEDFAITASFIEGLGLLYNHIFPFSRRPGTEADTMPGQIPENIKSARLHRLEAIRDESVQDILSARIGEEIDVLFEEYKDGQVIGHSANFMEIRCPAVADLRGRFGKITAKSVENGYIIGKIIEIKQDI